MSVGFCVARRSRRFPARPQPLPRGERDRGQGNRQGDENRRRKRRRQSREESADHALQPAEREEHHHRGRGGPDEGCQQGARRLPSSIRGGHTLLHALANGFDDHDRVVDDQPDCHGEAAERHEIQALAQNPHGQEGRAQGERDRQRCRKTRAQVAQEERYDRHAKGDADQDGITDRADGLVHQRGLVIDRCELDPGRQRDSELSRNSLDL